MQSPEIPHPKEADWEKYRAEVDAIADANGRGVDEGIKESLVALAANGIQTNQSCEGGDNDQHGEPYPWIQINVPEPDGWQEDIKLQTEWKLANDKQRERLSILLEEFSKDREVPRNIHLIIEDRGIYGSFILRSAGGEAMKSLSPEEQARYREDFRKELADFTEFLKSKFFNG